MGKVQMIQIEDAVKEEGVGEQEDIDLLACFFCVFRSVLTKICSTVVVSPLCIYHTLCVVHFLVSSGPMTIR